MTGFNLATYTLQIFGPESVPAEEGSAYRWGDSDKRLLSNLPAIMESVEEDLTDLLPDGYRAIIRAWDAA
jgi:hypothetical protein